MLQFKKNMQISASLKSKIKRHFAVILIYILLALIFTWPLVLHLSGSYPTLPGIYNGDGDPSVFLWLIAWAAGILHHGHAAAAQTALYYPGGFHALAGFDGLMVVLLGAPLYLLTGKLVLAYNLYILAAIVLNGYFTFLLGRYLKYRDLAAGLGGFIFGFSTYVLVRSLQHPNLILVAPLPLAVIAVLEFFKQPQLKSAIRLSLAVLFCALSSWYYALAISLFILVAAVGHYRILFSKIRQMILAAALIAVLLGVLALPVFFYRGTAGRAQTASVGFLESGSAQAANFFIPHPFGIFSTVRIRDIYSRFPSTYESGSNPYEATSYFGVAGILAVFYFLYHRRKGIIEKEKIWLVTAVLFAVLALGPVLQTAWLRLPLPDLLLSKIFPYTLFRVPNRFFVMALLAATVLAMFIFETLEQRLPRKKTYYILLILIIGLLAAERLMLPYPLVQARAPQFYSQLASLPGSFAVADIPISYPGYPEYDYYQAISGKPSVDGEYFYAAYDPKTFSYINENDLLAASVCSDSRSSILTRPPVVMPADLNAERQKVFADLKAHNIKYVIVHNFLLVLDSNCSASMKYVRAFFAGQKPVFIDGEITVFAVQ